MNLRSDQRQNVQGELDFSSSPAGEAREVGREETESLSAVHEPESPASTNRLMVAHDGFDVAIVAQN